MNFNFFRCGTVALLSGLCLFSVQRIHADDNPLWESLTLDSFTVSEPVDSQTAIDPAPPQPLVLALSLSVPDAVNAQITALAKALDNDPVRIFNHVRNNIHYQHYHGIRKGAILTLLEGGGNDFDQCALLAELLKAAGYTDITYRIRGHRIDYARLIDWIGLASEPHPGKTFQEAYGRPIPTDRNGASDLVAKRAAFALGFLSNGGSVSVWGTPRPWTTFPGKAQLVFDRMYLEVNVGGTIYDLDPSYKTYEDVAGLENILTSIGYSRSSMLSTAGGSTGAGYVKSLNSSNIEAFIENLNGNLLSYLAQNHPGLSLQDLISGRRIIQQDISTLSEAFPLPKLFGGTDTPYTILPDTYKSKVRFKSGTLDYTIPTSDLNGRKISLTFNGNTVELRLDDEAPIDTTSVSGSTFSMQITVTHHGHLDSKSEPKIYKKHNNYAYAILYGFTPSGRLLQQRYEQLSRYKDEGKADDSREVRTEILNIMGMTWLYQTELVSAALANINGYIGINHHRFGRMSQEEGFYVDVGLQFGAGSTRDGVTSDGRRDNVFHLGSLYASAMEHGIIEQMQDGAAAVSTVNILRKANDSGKKLYLADASNWDSSVKSKIDVNYSDSQVLNFTDLINNKGAKIFLPYNDNVSQGQWTGSGWVIRSPSQAGMIINGGYSGGYSTNHGYVSSPVISTGSFYNPTYNYTPSSIPIAPYVPPSISTPSFYGSDPVDMSTGAFAYAHTDMQTGVEEAPRGLGFSRQYSSNRSEQDSQNLGFGWTHSLHIRCAERTATEESLGLGTIQHVAPLLTSILVAQDLYRDDATAKDWGVSAITVGWFVDQMKDNGVSITIGNSSFQFLKQPDGTYQAPAGSTMSLERVSENFRLKQRHGNTIYFQNTQTSGDTSQRVQKIIDPDGKQLTFVYYGDDRIKYVQDASGRRYTFGYDSEDRITSIIDNSNSTGSTERSVGFQYDSEGNLDRSTDPEGKHFHFDYVVAGDPSGTTADEHRIVRMRNYDNGTVTQNIYDTLGRVSEQYLHGDTNKTWKMRYTGIENTEEDPDGGLTTYFYDDRGRSTGKMDADGNETRWKYDGQDRVVERTSAAGEVTVFHFDEFHNQMQVDYPRGAGSSLFTYDSLHRIDQITDAESNVTDYVYFTSGAHAGKNRPQKIIDPQGTTTYQYKDSGSAKGKIFKVTGHDSLITEYAYDSDGHPDWVKSPGGFLTDFQYTERGDLDYVDNPDGKRTDYTYNQRRQVTQTVHDSGGSSPSVVNVTYDNQGLPETSTAAADNDSQRVSTRVTYSPTEKPRFSYLGNDSGGEDTVGEQRYDGRDWQSSSFDALNRETSSQFFANGRVQTSDLPGTRDTTFLYDADGRLTSQTSPGSNAGARTTGYFYGVSDSASGDQTTGYPKVVFTDADNKTTTTETNRNGQTRFYTNKKNKVFEFRYDSLGRRTHVISPLDAENNRAHTTAYTHRGPPSLITEPSGDSAAFNYNSTTGRLDTLTYSGAGSSTVLYNHTDSYDSNGNVKHFSEGAKHIHRTYDSHNRVSTHTDVNGNQIGYIYYPSGKIAKIIYPSGTENGTGHVEYTYWKTGRLKNVIDKLDSTTSPRVSTYHWNIDGKLDRIERPNGTSRKITYDAYGRPAMVQEAASDGSALIHLSKHGYFDSDEMQWNYTLPKSPPIKRTPVAPITSATYRSDNSLDQFNGASVSHDADGNLTSVQGSVGVPPASYAYDSRNRLLTAGATTYTYGPEGSRLTNSEDGGTTYVTEANLGLSKILQRTKNGVTTRYVWGAGLLYEVDAAGATTTYHYNSSGSTIALTNDAKDIIERMDYSPFGQTIYRESLDGDTDLYDTPFLFTGFFGNQTDANGLIYMRARYYNPLLRRFLNIDPAREGWNWYGYAGGNPLAFVDPTGLGISSVLDAVQTTLGFLGMIPVVGNIFDAVNVGISLGRGNYGEAMIAAASAIPGAGLAAGGVGIFARTSRGALRSSSRSLFRTPTTTALSGPYINGVHVGSLGDVATRKWYHSNLDGISGQINGTQSLRNQARQAFDLRNQTRIDARTLMSNRAGAAALDISDPIRSWPQMIRHANSKGHQGSGIYEYILGSANKSRASTDAALGLGR